MAKETKELVGAAPSRRLGSRCHVPCLFYCREGAAPTKPYTANLLNFGWFPSSSFKAINLTIFPFALSLSKGGRKNPNR